MTTIATDGRTMAADGLVADQCDTIVGLDLPKIYRLPDGGVIGGAGTRADIEAWVEWYSGGKKGECPIDSERFTGIILKPDGVVLWVDHRGREMETPTPLAIGTGQDLAYGAMEAGASPEQAVEIACKRDIYSGGTIISLSLGPAVKAVA